MNFLSKIFKLVAQYSNFDGGNIPIMNAVLSVLHHKSNQIDPRLSACCFFMEDQKGYIKSGRLDKAPNCQLMFSTGDKQCEENAIMIMDKFRMCNYFNITDNFELRSKIRRNLCVDDFHHAELNIPYVGYEWDEETLTMQSCYGYLRIVITAKPGKSDLSELIDLTDDLLKLGLFIADEYSNFGDKFWLDAYYEYDFNALRINSKISKFIDEELS